jgi:hypothetical protein
MVLVRIPSLYGMVVLNIGKVDDNAYRLSLPPYMCIHQVVNVEILKLYKPSMLDKETKEKILPNIEDLAPEAQAELT